MAAKKPAPTKNSTFAAKAVEKTVSTPIRNTPIPKVAAITAPAPKVTTHEQIAKRAFEIAMGGTGGSELDNWYRAERELRGL